MSIANIGTFSTELTGTSLDTKLSDPNQYSSWYFRGKQEPKDHWTLPVVTGSSYRIKWSSNLDFSSMKISLGEYWNASDLKTFISFNHTDRRDKIQVLKNGAEIGAYSLATLSTAWRSYTNLTFGTQFKPEDSVPPVFTIFAGIKDATDGKTIQLNGIRCVDPKSCYDDAEGDIDPIP